LTLATVRTYASRGQFDPHDLEATLTWVNARRRARGLPQLGIAPEDPSDPSDPSDDPSDASDPPEDSDA
jgi:hypothetical protein